MSKLYTDEKNVLIIISLLKANGISKVIVSPGTTNVAFVASVQQDPFFKLYSAVDERSAAYMACGMAHETGEPVVISCTGATASRNYMPGMTEAYYRKLPVLSITSTQATGLVGHNIGQIIDRSKKPNDTQRLSVTLPIVKDEDDFWDCEVKVNQAILELKRGGGGPVHINLPTRYSKNYDTKKLPTCRVMDRFTVVDEFPEINGKVGIFVGAHRQFTSEEIDAIDQFCAANDAVVFCDHTSSFNGKYRVGYALAASQMKGDMSEDKPDITIHIGEVTGDYASIPMVGKEVWRVSPDGELRDTFKKLKYIFEMDEKTFFERYTDKSKAPSDGSLKRCQKRLEEIRNSVPNIPFSNVWVASRMAHLIPEGSVIHFGILNSLRSWNFFDLPQSVTSTANVGGFGIDGSLSSLIGASLANQKKTFFGVIGDLSFFYDMNALGNRHVGNNLRLMVVNNGKGFEMRRTDGLVGHFEEQADDFICALGHFGNKSPTLVKNYAQDLGLKYISASSKEEFDSVYQEFVVKGASDESMVFEVFTNGDDESLALDMIRNVSRDSKKSVKVAARRLLSDKQIKTIKKIIG
ncbi:2-succinyl-5-enolpyruvyl-6-hydroxy-3-cyclohexene-1-carboxylate synthase [Saccharospirillum mangrovi]|uniref:2-succinyl-5-enolpyruvyl-6-hydroxy-3- cyclohexene-1-carboxylate synthase n=1 Tax=Saccharospirillum mangrovi TaxID=2161747 RepID=UPI000D38521A|nr:thiamine pyrophosphate-binding protein [Saccharospirillum mangrovi]